MTGVGPAENLTTKATAEKNARVPRSQLGPISGICSSEPSLAFTWSIIRLNMRIIFNWNPVASTRSAAAAITRTLVQSNITFFSMSGWRFSIKPAARGAIRERAQIRRRCGTYFPPDRDPRRGSPGSGIPGECACGPNPNRSRVSHSSNV